MSNKLFSINEFRELFPILDQQVNGHPLIYLDNAATTQKPLPVIEAINHYYLNDNANVHRASHQLSTRATTAFETARETVCSFINAKNSKEIIWTKGTTEGFNLLTNVFSQQLVKGDEVIISTLEHHANIVPWKMLVESIEIILKVIPLKADNSLDLEAYQALLTPKTKFVSVAHISNALGVINPVEEIISLAHQINAQVIIDGAQAVAHQRVDVQALNCDYYLFSGHKLFAPTGIGVLYGKQKLLEALPPWQGGGEMIKQVSFSDVTYNELPFKFEAGTPNIAGAIGLAAAINFLTQYDRKMMMLHEQMLLAVAESALLAIPDVSVFCSGIPKSGAISFVVNNEHHSDIAMLLDAQGIAVRSGTHCAMPLLSALNCNGTIRISFSFYNTISEVNAFIEALKRTINLLKE